MFNYQDYYKGLSAKYNEIRLDAPQNFAFTIDTIKEVVTVHTPKLLDIGCGTGKYGEALEKIGYQVEGIDHSKSQVEEAQKVICARMGEACDLPYEDESFDVCTMMMMLHQIPNENRPLAVEEAYRVLKKNGVLIIKTVSEDDLPKRVMDYYFPEALEYDLKRYPKIEDVRGYVSKFGEIWTKECHLEIPFDKEVLIGRLAMRCSTNMGMISDVALEQGLNRMRQEYKDTDTIVVQNCNTFVIARKV